MGYLPNIFFIILFVAGIGFFVMNVRKLSRNIKLGKEVDRNDNRSERWKNMAMIAIGQSKMVKRPLSGFLHIIVYLGLIYLQCRYILFWLLLNFLFLCYCLVNNWLSLICFGLCLVILLRIRLKLIGLVTRVG